MWGDSVYGVVSCPNVVIQAALDKMSRGHMLADAVAIIGKLIQSVPVPSRECSNMRHLKTKCLESG